MAEFIAALVVTSVCAFVLLPVLRARVLDIPGHRSSHDRPTARGGGIAIAAGVVAGLAIGGFTADLVVALAVALFLGIVGLSDDLTGLGAGTRLGAQIVAGVVFALWIARSGGALDEWLWIVAFVVAVIWVVGVTNAFNFMDGINGISAVQLGVFGVALIAAGRFDPSLGAAGWASLAAGIGFLPWNYPVARMFMGDVGSYFAGAWIATTALLAVGSGVPIITVVAPLSLYLADTSVTLFRRVGRGATWHQAHREHAYQRLASGGWSHGLTTAVVAVLQVLALVIGIAAIDGGPMVAVAWIGATVLAVVYLALPTAVAADAGTRSRRVGS